MPQTFRRFSRRENFSIVVKQTAQQLTNRDHEVYSYLT